MADNEKSTRPMGYPAEGHEVPVQGILPGDTEGFEYARPVANPSDASEGEEPGYIRRRADK